MKAVNLQCVYDIPDSYPWIARNRDGVLCGFQNPPVRDYQSGNGEWIDSVDGSNGEIILYGKWELSVRETRLLKDAGQAIKDTIKNRQIKNTEDYRKRRKNGKAKT
jgi:hypothetical protein